MGDTKEFDLNVWESTPGQIIRETTNGIHVGALVSVDKNASYWNGQKVEEWYIRKKWYVTNLNGNKATLGLDSTWRYTFKSPISTSFLTVIKEATDGTINGKK